MSTPLTPETVPHGTVTGLNWHKRRRESACDACKDFGRTYQNQWRTKNKIGPDAERARGAARIRALRKLGRIYEAEFRALYEAELAKDERDA